MNGIDYLADTNAVIYLLKGNDCMQPYLASRLSISVISLMELLSFPDITQAEDKMIRELINSCEVLSLSEDIVELTIQIRKNAKVKLPDAIIAATAISHQIPLITADAGFNKIGGLKLEKLIP